MCALDEPTGANAIPPPFAATPLPLASTSTGTVSAADTTLSAPNACARTSSLPTPFCGVTTVVAAGSFSARRSVSIAEGVSYDFTVTIARSASTGSTAASSRGA